MSTRRLALAGMFAGLAWGAGYVDSIPNFEFLTVILFAGGWVLGPLGGALAGALGEFLYSVINPYGSGLMHPLVLGSQVLGMALAGAAGGWVGRLAIARPAARWLAVVSSGIAVTLIFDLITNLASGAVYGQWKATLVAALPFTLVHVGTNAALFASVGVLLVRALERTRRSLLAPAVRGAALVVALACMGQHGAWAQAPVDAQPPLIAPTPPDSLDAGAAATRGPAADSVGYRDASRASRPPTWGEGPAALLRRDDGSLAAALTREGGLVERFADDRGSAEPLGRFGIARANALLIDWLGMPIGGVGAVGGEALRVPWLAVSALEAPRLPVSAIEAYRGELGRVRLVPWPAIPRHPRVQGWAATGRPSTLDNGFTATGRARGFDGLLAIDAGQLGPLAPLGPEGHHGLAARVAWSDSSWEVSGAYRSARQALEDRAGRFERRSGEGGVARVARRLGAWTARGTFEGTTDRFVDEGDAIGLTTERGRGRRGTLALERGGAFAAVTYGRESLEAEGNVAFDRRSARLWWGSAGLARALGPRLSIEAAAGAGAYGKGKVDVAPSLLVSLHARPGTALWAGVARGLSAAPDPRATDAVGGPLAGNPPVARSSTWLGGVGVVHRSAWEEAGGSWRGAAPRGALRARAALYAGRSTPGTDPARYLFAGEAIESAALEPSAAATRFVALVATGSWSPLAGLTLDAGGHALGRTLDATLLPSDPEGRAFLALTGRRRLGQDGPDLGLTLEGEWIGPRTGTPSGNLPSALRLGVAGRIVIDEFELRARLGNAAGSNRQLPLLDPATSAPVRADGSLFRLEARWTFWD